MPRQEMSVVPFKDFSCDLFYLSGRCELEEASLLGDSCALVFGNKTRHQLRPEVTSLLRVEVALLLGLFHKADLGGGKRDAGNPILNT